MLNTSKMNFTYFLFQLALWREHGLLYYLQLLRIAFFPIEILWSHETNLIIEDIIEKITRWKFP
jgi:hypothetical protein